MQKLYTRISLLGIIGLLALLTIVIVHVSNAIPHNAQGLTLGSTISGVTKQLRQVLDETVANNQLVTDEQGTPVVAPEPAERAQQLQEQAPEALEGELARPAEQRVQATENLRAFVRDAGIQGEVQYQSTVWSPYDGAPVEYYVIDKYDALISIANDRVLQFGPRSLAPGQEGIAYDVTPTYSPEELEAMARSFIQKRAPELDLDEFTSAHGDKEGTHYFFQWNKSSQERIHVGYTVGGDFLSYLDTLTTKNSQP